MDFVQQNENCSDFDVLVEGHTSPSFRMLLPEAISCSNVDLAEEFGVRGGLHCIPGHWETHGEALEGEFQAGDALVISVGLLPRGTYVDIAFAVKNLTDLALEGMRADFCLSPNNLPGNPGWSNAEFVACEPVERSAQGRYWYEKRAPERLRAWINGNWASLHPCPDSPKADDVPPYEAIMTPEASTQVYAIESEDGRSLLFQMWNVPCYAQSPFHGNACLHLQPVLSRLLKPGVKAAIRGKAGVFEGTRQELLALLEEL